LELAAFVIGETLHIEGGALTIPRPVPNSNRMAERLRILTTEPKLISLVLDRVN
jgi:hypothetical protein